MPSPLSPDWTLRLGGEEHHHLQAAQAAEQALRQRQDLGFFDPSTIATSLRECKDLGASFLKDKKKLAVIGFGGSSLGAQALCESLFPGQNRVHFFDNVDSEFVERSLAQLGDLSDVAWLICSKSGSTIEVLMLVDYISQHALQKAGLSFVGRTAVVCGPGVSPLANFAKTQGLPTMTIAENVGGRFSVFTAAGLLPLQFLGSDLGAIERGFLRGLEAHHLVQKLSGFLLQGIDGRASSLYCFQYCDRLKFFGLWLQQLWSESLSKAIDLKGQPAPIVPTFVPCRGSSDQHSVLQQIAEGREQKMVIFHRVRSSEQGPQLLSTHFPESLLLQKPFGELFAAQAEGTEAALRSLGLRTGSLSSQDLTEQSLAELMTIWMLVVGSIGQGLGIDAFNQPGVESSKQKTRRVLQSLN